MSTTLANVLTRLAYRMGEDSSPTDSDEKNRRINAIGEGYRKTLLSTYWWWTGDTDTFNSVADQGEYDTTDGFPADYRDMIELRVDDIVYTHIPQSKVFGLYDKTKAVFNYDNLVTDKHWYYFANTLYLYPDTASAGTDNISMKYYKWPTIPSSDSDTFDMPDVFTTCLDAYALGKLKLNKNLRGDASDAFNEYNEIIGDMKFEENRQKFHGKSSRPVHPSYLVS